jgi:hypothetical protein
MKIGDLVTVKEDCTALTNFPEVKGKVGEIVGLDSIYDFEVYFSGGKTLYFDERELDEFCGGL